MIVAEQFLKSIPKDIKQRVLNKLSKFEQQFLQAENQIRELPAGYWVRRIKNTDIFKFRLNNKDRILFSFINTRGQEGYSEVIFIKYATHDKQIREGRNIDTERLNPSELEINMTCYEQESDEQEIEAEVVYWIKDGRLDLSKLPAIVVKDEWLPLLSDETNTDFLYYLSDEQYKVLENLEQPVVLSGAGGTGKTVVLVNALSLVEEKDEKALYLSYSMLLVERTEELYRKYIVKDQEKCTFFTMEQFLGQVIKDEIGNIATTHRVMAWLEKNIIKYTAIKKKDAYEILGEINGIIKGYLGLEYREVENVRLKDSTKLSLEQYLNIPAHYSTLSEEEKNAAYKLTEAYEKWLKKEKLTDINDLSRKVIMQSQEKWDWIIVDEVQDLSEVQIYMISQLLKPGGHIIWAGDMNQTINPTFFHFGRINNLYYTYGIPIKSYTLKKNYRSTRANIEFINEITAVRRKVIGASKYDYEEISIKEGEKPILLNQSRELLERIIENVKDKHYCAILVPNQRVQEQLIEHYKETEKRIFMLHEIKGLEYENILCYNIMSTYANSWREILEGKHKNQEHMKYYFNLLYVAASRAKNKLTFYEEESLNFGPFSKCDRLDYYDEMRLGLDKVSSEEEWKEEAIRLEKAGQESHAKFARQHVGLIRDYKYEEFLDTVNKEENISKDMFSETVQDVKADNGIDRVLEPGIRAYRQKNYTEARVIFDEAREKYPDQAKIYYYLANTYAHMSGGIDYSIRFFEKAIELDSYQYEYYIDMAWILYVSKQYGEALRVLKLVSQIYPQLANAYELQSTIYDELGNHKMAISMCKEGKRYPRCSYDEHTKTWRKPQLVGKVVKLNQSEIIKREVIDTKRKGLEYLQLERKHYIRQCVEGITLKRYEYKENKKAAYIQFDIQSCNICSKKRECIFSESNKKGNLKISEAELRSLTPSTLEGKQECLQREYKVMCHQMNIIVGGTNKLIDAELCYNQGEFKSAISKYNEVIYMIEKSGDSSEKITNMRNLSYCGLGKCYLNLDDLGQAEKYLKVAAEADSEQPYEAYNSLGIVYFRKQKFGEAIELFANALGDKSLYKVAINNISQAQCFKNLQEEYNRQLRNRVGESDKEARKALVYILIYIDMHILSQLNLTSYVWDKYMKLGHKVHDTWIEASIEREKIIGKLLEVPYKNILGQNRDNLFTMREFARRIFYCEIYMKELYEFFNKEEHKEVFNIIKSSRIISQEIFEIAYFAAVDKESRCML